MTDPIVTTPRLLPLDAAYRAAEAAVMLGTHPLFSEFRTTQIAAAAANVVAAEKAFDAAAPAERDALHRALIEARRVHCRVSGMPDPDDPSVRFAGAAAAFLTGTRPAWFDDQVANQEQQIRSLFPTHLPLTEQVARNPPPRPAPGSIFVGTPPESWATGWRG